MQYASRINKTTLVNKLRTIIDEKEQKEVEHNEHSFQDNFTSNNDFHISDQEIIDISLPIIKEPEIEIKPLSMSQTLKRANPFRKIENVSMSPKGKRHLSSFFYPKKFLLLNLSFLFIIL